MTEIYADCDACTSKLTCEGKQCPPRMRPVTPLEMLTDSRWRRGPDCDPGALDAPDIPECDPGVL